MTQGLIAWAWYAAATGALVIVAAEALDRAARLARWQTRWVWLSAIIATIGVLAYGPHRPVARGLAASAAAIPLNAVFVLLWCGASFALLVRLVVSFSRAHVQLVGFSVRDLDGIDVQVSDAIGPALVGLFRPRVVVPWWFLALPKADRVLVMLHEREHQRARDPLVGAFGELALALVPWHVALWYAVRRLRRALELDCDARVLRRESNVERYGHLLLRCARSGGLAGSFTSWLRGPAGTLELRIRAMTAPPPARRLQPACLYAITLCAALIGISTLRRPAPLVLVSPALSALPVAMGDID
ncbi:MAG TPA: M56 family metallopeptidase, partial [Gemmatimonadaceae bacterium]|nr:M56 family metallopeptidase [Gemmatimonadaceae bacterium]